MCLCSVLCIPDSALDLSAYSLLNESQNTQLLTLEWGRPLNVNTPWAWGFSPILIRWVLLLWKTSPYLGGNVKMPKMPEERQEVTDAAASHREREGQGGEVRDNPLRRRISPCYLVECRRRLGRRGQGGKPLYMILS